MTVLLLGLVLFLGMHSVRIFAEGWRTAMFQRLGEQRWKALFSIVSIIGFVLIMWGYALARQDPTVLWPQPPTWMRHIAALLTLLAFVLLAAAYVPNNEIRARLKHPMVLGVKAWALAHLLANNTLADVLLFGSFLAWAVLAFISEKRRDKGLVTIHGGIGTAWRTVVTALVGVVLWAGFAFWLHARWLGVAPMGVSL